MEIEFGCPPCHAQSFREGEAMLEEGYSFGIDRSLLSNLHLA